MLFSYLTGFILGVIAVMVVVGGVAIIINKEVDKIDKNDKRD